MGRRGELEAIRIARKPAGLRSSPPNFVRSGLALADPGQRFQRLLEANRAFDGSVNIPQDCRQTTGALLGPTSQTE